MFGLKKRIFDDAQIARRQEIGGTWGSYQSQKATGVAAGLVAGTLVATAMGWRPVEAIAEGDLVLTFDRGMQPVRGVIRAINWDHDTECPKSLWPLKVPAGALGNRSDMTLLPEQSVMVESDTADMLFGDPFTLLNAADLDGFRGIERVHPEAEIDVIQLNFDDDEIIFANAGALVFCPSLAVINMAELMRERDVAEYATLPSDEAAMLIECLRDEDVVAGGWDAPAPMSAAARMAQAAFA